MRIFFICHRVPFPPDRGDKIATFNIIRHLALKHEVHVFCLADGSTELANVTGLAEIAASVTAIRLSTLFSWVRVLAALFSRGPLSVAMLSEPGLHAAVQRRFAELRPEAIILYSSSVAQFAEQLDVPRIMHFSDLDSLKWREYAKRLRSPIRWIFALESRRLLEHERCIARSFARSLVCTEAEAQEFRILIPQVPVSVVRNGVDLEYFQSTGTPKTPGSLVFTGVMNYVPNVDAVRWFCSEIFPLVRKEVPEATLTICGNRPLKAVRRLSGLPGVTVTGWVPDVRPYLDRAEVFIAPIRLARGIQNKLLEAMAMGLPIVATRATWRPTGVCEGDGMLAEDEPAGFAARVIQLLRDTPHREAMGRSARAAMERDFTWAKQIVALDRIIADEVSGSRA